jgi:hypothetical protein
MPDETSCPIACPNRKQNAVQGKVAAYGFALLCSCFLAFNCLSHERKGEEVPATTWMPCLLLIGTALGVNIDPSDLLSWLKQ